MQRVCIWLASALAILAVQAPPASADFDIPTGAAASPLFGAQPFSQPMLRLEEFGSEPSGAEECSNCGSLPPALDCQSGPDGDELDRFLTEQISPLPTRWANESLPNPWHQKIGECVRPLTKSVIEGRPGGEDFAHQRWQEFPPEVYFKTAQAGARVNQGLRDDSQKHAYTQGEFAPSGLYHDTGGGERFRGTTNGIPPRFHPKLPVQDPRAVWTFDGTFPPKLLMARYGYPILFRHYNALPIDPAANYGFGLHTISTHEHNGHNPAESDGYTQAFFFPGQFFDYRWPMILAGHDRTNPDATDPRAATIDDDGKPVQIPGDWRETMSTHWFHDHMLDFTAQNVYKGNVAMMNYYSALDRGNEAIDCHYADPTNVNLCLPSGSASAWGNRDYDVNLLLADKAWDQDGQLFFNIFNLDGFLGDRMTVNWLYKPYMQVRARRYRFRILNGSVSRYFKIALVDQNGKRVPHHMVANDGNLMEHAVPFPNAESVDLPTQAIAERYDIVVDFSNFEAGDRVYMVNLLEHKDGRGPERAIPLEEVLASPSCAVDPANGNAGSDLGGATGIRGSDGTRRAELLARREEAASRREESAARRREESASRREESASRREESAARRREESASRREESASRREESASRREESASRREESASRREESAARRREESARRREESASRREESASRREELSSPPELGSEIQASVESCVENSDAAISEDPAVGKFLEFRVVAYEGNDSSMDPVDYVEGKKKMIPLPGFTSAELANARHRTFEFGRSSGTDSAPWTIKTDGGQGFGMDPDRISAAPEEGSAEIWHLENGGGGWGHPIHIHFEEGQILQRGGQPPPLWEKWARKDVYRVGSMPDSGQSVTVALRFREFLGTYLEHCHNTQHEDHAMMLRWDIENPGDFAVMPTPMPTWEGVGYVDSYGLPSATEGDREARDAANRAAVPESAAPDVDGDGVPDALDNCSERVNSEQRDTDNDGYGNLCDPDLDNNGIVDMLDFVRLRTAWGSRDTDSDFNADGIVDMQDFLVLFGFFLEPPGPGVRL
jgi:FtsP/CotA-like multicopper oxidase with cupredoxin domain